MSSSTFHSIIHVFSTHSLQFLAFRLTLMLTFYFYSPPPPLQLPFCVSSQLCFEVLVPAPKTSSLNKVRIITIFFLAGFKSSKNSFNTERNPQAVPPKKFSFDQNRIKPFRRLFPVFNTSRVTFAVRVRRIDAGPNRNNPCRRIDNFKRVGVSEPQALSQPVTISLPPS